MTGSTTHHRPLTEADVRRIVREEIDAARLAEGEWKRRATALLAQAIGELSWPVVVSVEDGMGGFIQDAPSPSSDPQGTR